jgi:hypothetical protein
MLFLNLTSERKEDFFHSHHTRTDPNRQTNDKRFVKTSTNELFSKKNVKSLFSGQFSTVPFEYQKQKCHM